MTYVRTTVEIPYNGVGEKMWDLWWDPRRCGTLLGASHRLAFSVSTDHPHRDRRSPSWYEYDVLGSRAAHNLPNTATAPQRTTYSMG
jgi:hypothetical protein